MHILKSKCTDKPNRSHTISVMNYLTTSIKHMKEYYINLKGTFNIETLVSDWEQL